MGRRPGIRLFISAIINGFRRKKYGIFALYKKLFLLPILHNQQPISMNNNRKFPAFIIENPGYQPFESLTYGTVAGIRLDGACERIDSNRWQDNQ